MAKKFRVGVSGATTDGRNISPEWLTQMAKNYQPETFTALVNLEHVKGMLPDSPFRNYGKVTALETAEVEIFGKKQTALVATIEPTAELKAFNAKQQKLFTSMEVNPKFADTGEAYLVGLAVTDNPASLGTQMLEFAAKSGKTNLFSEALELDASFTDDEEKPGLLEKIKAMFAGKGKADETRFADQEAAILELAAAQKTALEQFAATAKDAFTAFTAELTAKQKATDDALVALKAELSRTPGGRERPPVTGGTGANLTDC